MSLLRTIFSGELLRKWASRHWKLFLYVFCLVLLYITLHFWMRNTAVRMTRNEEIIKNMRSEYIGKYNDILYQSKRGEIEELLKKGGSDLQAPEVPPTRVKLRR